MAAFSLFQSCVRTLGLNVERIPPPDEFPVIRPIDRNGVEILADPAFQASCLEIGNRSLLDTPRLANLWMLSRLTDLSGAMLEIGTYKGGGALHLSNACPEREIVVCDPFTQESFDHLDPKMDQTFRKGQFAGATMQGVSDLLKNRKTTIIQGYFPASVQNRKLPPVSFVHLDVDVYKATRESLRFLLSSEVLCQRSLIVVDDYNRRADGVNNAVAEVVEEISGTIVLPLFPGQAVLIPRTFSHAHGNP